MSKSEENVLGSILLCAIMFVSFTGLLVGGCSPTVESKTIVDAKLVDKKDWTGNKGELRTTLTFQYGPVIHEKQVSRAQGNTWTPGMTHKFYLNQYLEEIQ